MSRTKWVAAGGAVLAVVVATGIAATISKPKHATSTALGPPASTAEVQTRTLAAMVSLDGTLTYKAGPDGTPYSVINQAEGTYTDLPLPGQVITEGQVLYRVDDAPVVLLYGSTPAYRNLSPGVTGADVAELNADLLALGYTTSAQLGPSSSVFGWATTSALEKLQSALGVTRNGTLALGQVVFEPTAVRVTSVSVLLGGSTQAGQMVMQGTSTARQVQLSVDVSQQSDVAVGDEVTITLPNEQTTPGVVSSVGTVATCPSASGSGGSSPSSTGAVKGVCSAASDATTPNATTPSIAVEVTLSDPRAAGTWDQAPVQVTVSTASVPNALVVPVTALLAQASGNYAVEVVDRGETHHLVAVSLGLFDDADGLVQVTGSELAVGQEVVVPAT